MKLMECLQEIKALRDEASAIKSRASSENRECTTTENTAYNAKAGRIMALEDEARAIHGSPNNSLIRNLGGDFSKLLTGGMPGPTDGPMGITRRGQTQMSAEYNQAFLAFVRSGGKQTCSALSEGFDPMFGGFALPALQGMSAAMYEGSQGGSTTAGGYAINVPTDNLIVPLAVPDLGVRALSRAIPTATDIKLPRQGTFGTAGWKLESGASSNLFVESDPALEQFTLSAFMTGLTNTLSWELMQDVQMFQEFAVRDLLNAVDINEDAAFVSGTGTNQPQGLVGNTGTGTGSAYLVESTGVYLLNALDDIVGTLKGAYYPGAAFLTSRQTFAAIVKAQRQANLFAPIVTMQNGKNYIHGFPVAFSNAMPALPTATTSGVVPLLFGSFQDGYVIGDRGGAGTFVKILDQVNATAGQTVLLAYKRVDGRVRRSEAIQAVTVSHS